ncbi:hypothetical protein GGX14DRAFT_390185 [Mycena pura]|uniref:Uncharacterized protein n=1 Tax=Mycena pura TaxID=153505 RepID=A0AAD6VRU6_9AGAR|nr:hypothetical protein GGX14DRAFT_390185 [Mycena pura]
MNMLEYSSRYFVLYQHHSSRKSQHCRILLCWWDHVRRHLLFLIRDDGDGDDIFSDGPGAFDFVQGDNKMSQNPFWELVKRFVTAAPPAEQIEYQPLLLASLASILNYTPPDFYVAAPIIVP